MKCVNYRNKNRKEKKKPEKVMEYIEIDYSDFPEGREVTVLKLKEK